MRRAVVPALVLCLLAGSAGAADPIRTLVFTGGHGFEHEPFLALFRGYSDVTAEEVVYPGAAEFLAPDRAAAFDVLVFYDMFTGLDAKAKESFARLIRDGKPAIFLHHSIASHQDWPEYEKIIGGRYYTRAIPAEKIEVSKYYHDQDVNVRVADPDHPIVRGISHFTIHDETYQEYRRGEKVHVLLTTDHPKSDSAVAWVHTYGQGRVAYIQLGHDGKAYANPAYRRLIVQAIRWAAKRPVEGGAFTPLYN
ncbi:MAG: ThuA domain-containing protein, partial [Planctomycetes bacterium]|nr:ThuA domain-containing protein [Planctomycetota bacterium]